MKHAPHHLVVGTLAVALTSGCLWSARARVQPVDVDVYEPTSSVVYVSEPMPPPRVEVVRTVAPSSDVLWVDGYWQWGGGGYVWTAGRWARPSRPGYVWLAPRYERRQGRHVYIQGAWGPRTVRVQGDAGRGYSQRAGRGYRRGPPPPARRARTY
jgi:YXWGXW repeat-containing protein